MKADWEMTWKHTARQVSVKVQEMPTINSTGLMITSRLASPEANWETHSALLLASNTPGLRQEATWQYSDHTIAQALQNSS